MTTHFFLGANSGEGFQSLYSDLVDLEKTRDLLVLKGGPGGEEAFVLGVQGESAALADGEVELRSEAASITLRNDGAILLQGNVIINGEAYQPCQCKSGGIAEGGQG